MSDDKIISLKEQVIYQFSSNQNSDHGPDHWNRVEKVGLILSKEANADKEIIRLFAILHDLQRIFDGYDPEHGSRAADYAQKLFDDGLLVLDQSQLKILKFACKYHNDKKAKSKNKTVNICWDSDRIDLVRVGINPKDIELKTTEGKRYMQKKYG